MLFSFFQLSLGIRNVYPKRMSLKAFLMLYIVLLLAGAPVTLLSCIPYGLFGILVAVCIYGLVVYRDTASRNVCMGMIGCVLTVIIDNLLVIPLSILIPSSFSNQPFFLLLLHLLVYCCFMLLRCFAAGCLKNCCCQTKGLCVWNRRGI